MEVKRRTGAARYEVELRPGVLHMVHTDLLKPFITVERVELFYFGASDGDQEE